MVSLSSQVLHLRGAVRALLLAPRPVRKALRQVRWTSRVARHLAWYRAPGERHTCPACGAPAPVPLRPIPIEGHARTYGFASGCTRCGIVFANPFPADEHNAEVYTPEGEWGRHRQAEQEKQVSRGRIEQLFAPVAESLNVLEPPPGAAVLDFGCGLGGMLDGFASLGWNTYGVEPATKLAFTRHHELVDIPSSATFDVGVLHHVLEHVTGPMAILQQMHGAMRTGGILLVKVPNLDAVAVHGEMKYCIRAGVHVLAYTGACLRWLLAEAGFEVVSDRSGFSAERQRHRIVLARRVASPVERPGTPLDAARAAFKRYDALHELRWSARLLPVRMQGALLDLERTEWRI